PSPFCYTRIYVAEDVVDRLELSPCLESEILVGDLAKLWDNQPIIVSLPPDELVYGIGSMNVEGWPAPYRRVNYISLFSPDSQFWHYPWHGYLLQYRYCQLVPTFPRCRLVHGRSLP